MINLHVPAHFQEKGQEQFFSAYLILFGTTAASHTLYNVITCLPCTFFPCHWHSLEFSAFKTSQGLLTLSSILQQSHQEIWLLLMSDTISTTLATPPSLWLTTEVGRPFLRLSLVFFYFNFFPHQYFCDMLLIPVCLCPDCHSILFH